MNDTRRLAVAVLLSGSGRTLENFLNECEAGCLPVDIAAVVSSRGDVRGLEIARAAGIPVEVFRRKDYEDIRAHNEAVNIWLRSYGPRMILLAGYLCYFIRPDWYDGPVLNIHPALLPAHGGKGMYGDRVHAAVLAAGESETGCTVHLVNEVYDDGEILGQSRVPVLPDDTVDTLATRVFAAECMLYPRVVRELALDMLAGRSG